MQSLRCKIAKSLRVDLILLITEYEICRIDTKSIIRFSKHNQLMIRPILEIILNNFQHHNSGHLQKCIHCHVSPTYHQNKKPDS